MARTMLKYQFSAVIQVIDFNNLTYLDTAFPTLGVSDFNEHSHQQEMLPGRHHPGLGKSP
jgi:hypothetical protein